MFNQYATSTHCQHNIPAISCSLCNRTQPIEYNQMQSLINQYEDRLKEFRNIEKKQAKTIEELSVKLAYAELSLRLATAEEPIEQEYCPEDTFDKQYLYVYNDSNRRESWMSPTFMLETYGQWQFMGKVEVIK